MTNLAGKSCEPCEKGTPPLNDGAIARLKHELHADWILNQEKHLERRFKFRDFKKALLFANRVGAAAEEEGHHPDLLIGWGHCTVQFWTHAIGGLSENDFIMATKVDSIPLE